MQEVTFDDEHVNASDVDQPGLETVPHQAMDTSQEIARLARELKRLSERLVRESETGTQPFRVGGYRWLPRET